jgi:glycosyltransferase involved in cell wall biosynthesis
MKVSVVITLLNEEDSVAPLLEALAIHLGDLSYEIILVDDGSTDHNVNRIKALATHRVKLLIFNKNYGQTTAMAAGIQYANGEYTVTMDGDLQNDPADIWRMLEKIEKEGWGLITGRRNKRKDGMIFRKLPSELANKLIRWLTGVHIHDYGCSLKIFRTDIAKNLGLYGELHRFIPVLAKMQGASITEMNVRHHLRIYGQSKYGLGRTFKVMSDLLLMIFFQKYVQKPMHLFGTLGILSFLAGCLIKAYLLIEKLLGHDIWGRPLLLLGVLLVLGGIQLITFGFMAELIMRTYFESQNKTPYQIKEVFFGKSKTSQKPVAL